MRNKINYLYLSYFVFFAISTIFPKISFISMLALVLTNAIFAFVNKSNIIIALMSSFILPNEIIAILNFVIIDLIGFGFKNKSIRKIDCFLISMLGVIGGTSAISAFKYGTFVNIAFSLMYIVMLLYVVHVLKDNLKDYEVKQVTKKLIVLESVVSALIFIKYQAFFPADINYGTFMNAHLFGNWLIVSALILFGSENHFENIKSNWTYLILIGVMLYFSDSKVLILCFIILFVAYPILNFLSSKKNGIAISFILLYLVMYISVPIINSNPVKKFINNNFESVYKYVYQEEWNYKFKYIKGTLYNELKGYNLIAGMGLGQYGSRFANLLAYDVSYRNENFINNFVSKYFEPHHNPAYVKYISFYDEDFVNEIADRSAVLSYPFSSLITIIGETGIVGVILIAMYANKLFGKSKYKNVFYYFLLTCLFDNYLDMFLSAGLVIFSLSIKKEEEIYEKN